MAFDFPLFVGNVGLEKLRLDLTSVDKISDCRTDPLSIC